MHRVAEPLKSLQAAGKAIVDPVYEQVKNGRYGYGSILLVAEPELVRAFGREELEIRRRAEKMRVVCESVVQKYALLEKSDAFFARFEKEKEELSQYYRSLKILHRKEPRLAATIKSIDERVKLACDARTEFLRDQKDKWELVYGKSRGVEFRDGLVKEIVGAVSEAAMNVGTHGRITISLDAVLKLSSKMTIEHYPGTYAFRSLAIRGIMLNEQDPLVRLSVIDRSGLVSSEHLKADDLLVFDATLVNKWPLVPRG